MAEQGKRRKARLDSTGDTIFVAFCYIAIILLVIITFYPFWDLFILSISPRGEALRPGLRLYTLNPTLESYAKAIGSLEILRSFKNSVVRVICGTILSTFVVTLAGYPLTKREMPFVRTITMVFLFTMYFSGGLIPTYLLIKMLGMMDTIWVLILPGAASAYNLVIMRSFIENLPQSLEESARIDGASFFRVWWNIIVPLSKPVIATVTLWIAVGHWNAYFDAMIYMHSRSNYTLPVVLRRILLENQLDKFVSSVTMEQVTVQPTPETLKGAIIMVSTVPILAVYPFLQKHFAKGVMLGAVKG